MSRLKRGIANWVLSGAVALCAAGGAKAQALWFEAGHDLPAGTAFAEYYNLSALRGINGYQAMKSLYTGDELQRVVKQIASFGPAEEDLSELVMASPSVTGAGGWYGLVAATVNSKALAASARKGKLIGASMSGHPVFCQKSEAGGLCITLLDDVVWAFGSFERIKSIVDTQQGWKPSMATDSGFQDLLNERSVAGQVTGIADGRRLGDWIKDALKGQDSSTADWTKVLPNVKAFAYTVNLTDSAHLDLHLECTSETEAMALRQLLKMALPVYSAASPGSDSSGLRLRNVSVEGSDRRVDVSLDSSIPRA